MLVCSFVRACYSPVLAISGTGAGLEARVQQEEQRDCLVAKQQVARLRRSSSLARQ